ncbi:hypothetical protein [Bradyrhizobium sp.]|nr:hypothetical protein [Bradyrhizobium sp.]HMM87927.1 hypothetical protein [Bradyrhizobium sp.]
MQRSPSAQTGRFLTGEQIMAQHDAARALAGKVALVTGGGQGWAT